MIIKSLKKITLKKSKIIKIYNKKKDKKKINEVYLVTLKKGAQKDWRQHLNANKTLINLEGIIGINIKIKNRIIFKKLKQFEKLYLPKKTIFNFNNQSKKESKLLVFSDLENFKLSTNKKFDFIKI